ncbi:hypothetical protein T265_10489 [Opisthorchis viverrini]|uniref:Uncharacterized protein n=1 Tax=Opisthorchis viverrini TaxID=6198 RepID=A0A075A161_OPIVI|nr:hypothetical protein T265_10489 [Opisthorchis viverrini]KER21129.1 hypothetical protein T265_10489 [Opisthorchis viverrini]
MGELVSSAHSHTDTHANTQVSDRTASAARTRTSETNPFRAVRGDLVFGTIRPEYSDGPMTYEFNRSEVIWCLELSVPNTLMDP